MADYRIRCDSCGYKLHEAAGDTCGNPDGHDKSVSGAMSEEERRQKAMTRKVQVGSSLWGFEAAKLHLLARSRGVTVAEQAAWMIRQQLASKARYHVIQITHEGLPEGTALTESKTFSQHKGTWGAWPLHEAIKHLLSSSARGFRVTLQEALL